MLYVALLAVGLFVLYKVVDRLLRIPRLSLRSRYIFITGCDSGFGRAAAERLDAMGCHVFAGCLTEKGELELRKNCSSRLVPVPLNVTKPDSVRKAFQVVKDRLQADGGKDLWAVLNNAGFMGPNGPPEWMTLDDYRQVSDVNLYGLIDVTMTFLPLIKKSRGRVVNVSSSSGRFVHHVFVPYCVSKHGVEAFSDGIRRSLRRYGVKVSIIEPGGHQTNMINVKSLHANFATAWNRLSVETREEFGEEYFEQFVGPFVGDLKMIPATPTDVVNDYIQALSSRFPRARYTPGFDVKYIFAPLASLPEWFSDWAAEKLHAKPPVPAFLQKHLN